MIEAGDTIENRVTGERILFHRTATETGGNSVLIECWIPPGGSVTAARASRTQYERFEVLAGTLAAQTVGEPEVYAGPGERVTVMRGRSCRLWNPGETELHLVCEAHPARGFRERLERDFARDAKTPTQAEAARSRPIHRAARVVHERKERLMTIFRPTPRKFAFLLALLAALAATSVASASSIVFMRIDGNIYRANADGSGQVAVTRDGTPADPYRFAAQADDGTIVVTRSNRLHRLSKTGEPLREPIVLITLTDGTQQLDPGVAVSPDGRTVAYTIRNYESYFDSGCQCRRLREGLGIRTRYGDPVSGEARGSTIDVWTPSFIDNGRLLLSNAGTVGENLFTAAVGGPGTPFYMDPARSPVNPRRNGFHLWDAELTRAGDKLAVMRASVVSVSEPANRTIQIYATSGVSAAPTPRCTIGPGRQIAAAPSPSWSPDGTTLVWEERDGIWSSPVNLGAPNCGLAPRLIVPGGAQPDWGPADMPRATVVRDRVKPRAAGLRIARAGGTYVLTFRLSEAALVGAKVDRVRGKRNSVVRRLAGRSLPAGPARLAVGRLAAGRYRVTLMLRDRAGNRSTVTKSISIG